MAFPNKPHRRVNYKYLSKLSDALEELGHNIREVPTKVLRSPWPDIKAFLEDELNLRVCGWCKIPLPQHMMAPASSMCVTHLEQLQISHERRIDSGEYTYQGIRSSSRNTPFVQAMRQQLREAREQDSPPLDLSMPEPPRKSSVSDILERAEVRSPGNADTKKD
jgi:hypothetical protein